MGWGHGVGHVEGVDVHHLARVMLHLVESGVEVCSLGLFRGGFPSGASEKSICGSRHVSNSLQFAALPVTEGSHMERVRGNLLCPQDDFLFAICLPIV